MLSQPDKSICPNCGDSNNCDLMKESSNGICWCFGKPIYSEKLSIDLENDPTRQCFCSNCLNLN
jgi:hypothetical protein